MLTLDPSWKHQSNKSGLFLFSLWIYNPEIQVRNKKNQFRCWTFKVFLNLVPHRLTPSVLVKQQHSGFELWTEVIRPNIKSASSLKDSDPDPDQLQNGISVGSPTLGTFSCQSVWRVDFRKHTKLGISCVGCIYTYVTDLPAVWIWCC